MVHGDLGTIRSALLAVQLERFTASVKRVINREDDRPGFAITYVMTRFFPEKPKH
jgi:hypothetical protein